MVIGDYRNFFFPQNLPNLVIFLGRDNMNTNGTFMTFLVYLICFLTHDAWYNFIAMSSPMKVFEVSNSLLLLFWLLQIKLLEAAAPNHYVGWGRAMFTYFVVCVSTCDPTLLPAHLPFKVV